MPNKDCWRVPRGSDCMSELAGPERLAGTSVPCQTAERPCSGPDTYASPRSSRDLADGSIRSVGTRPRVPPLSKRIWDSGDVRSIHCGMTRERVQGNPQEHMSGTRTRLLPTAAAREPTTRGVDGSRTAITTAAPTPVETRATLIRLSCYGDTGDRCNEPRRMAFHTRFARTPGGSGRTLAVRRTRSASSISSCWRCFATWYRESGAQYIQQPPLTSSRAMGLDSVDAARTRGPTGRLRVLLSCLLRLAGLP